MKELPNLHDGTASAFNPSSQRRLRLKDHEFQTRLYYTQRPHVKLIN